MSSIIETCGNDICKKNCRLASCKLSITTENQPFSTCFFFKSMLVYHGSCGAGIRRLAACPAVISARRSSTGPQDRNVVGKKGLFLLVISLYSLVAQWMLIAIPLYDIFYYLGRFLGSTGYPKFSWISELRELAMDAVCGSLDGCRLLEKLSMRWVQWWVLKHGFYMFLSNLQPEKHMAMSPKTTLHPNGILYWFDHGCFSS